MDDFFEKEDYSEKDVNQLIEGSIEESLNLEFKSGDSLGRQNGKKKEIAKDVSAFANSDGGIIIYGIREEGHVASSLSFINGDEFTKEWLEQILNTNIQRRIKNIKIFPIRFDGRVDQTIYIVKIPTSSWAPHLCNDNRYYRRFNFESVPMEEYEIRNLFNRREKTKLKIEKVQIKKHGITRRNRDQIIDKCYKLTCSIINDSNSVENFYKILLVLPSQLVHTDGNIHHHFDHVEKGMNYYSIPGNSPIFQNEILTMFTASIKLTPDLIEHIYNNFHITLFYSNGSEERTLRFIDVMNESGIDPLEDFEMYA